MSIFYTMDTQSTIVTCKAPTIAEAKTAAINKMNELIDLGNYAVLDDFGVEAMPGICFWNVLVKKRNYK